MCVFLFLRIVTNISIVCLGPSIDICDGKAEGGRALAKSGPNDTIYIVWALDVCFFIPTYTN